MSSGADGDGLTALTRAVASGNVEEVQSLIDSGSDVNKSDGKGTPLFYAAKNCTILKLLLEAGAKVNASASDHSTPLIEAVRGKHPDCVDGLIQAGANVGVSDDKKVTPLIAAIGDTKCMDILIKAGTQLNPKVDAVKRNPLLEAVDKNEIKSVKFLMEKGAKVPPADKCELHGVYFGTKCKAPLWSAIKSENMDMFNTLVAGGADLEDGIRATAYNAHYRGLKLMVEAGANVNCVDEYRNTVLMRAAYTLYKDNETRRKTRLSCVKLILEAGARVNKTNRQDRNALERCLKKGPVEFRKDLARLLFAAGEKIRNPEPESDILKALKAEEDDIMSLQAICRKSIRRHLLGLDPYLNLFKRIPKLEASFTVIDYMLFGCTLDVKPHEIIDGADSDKVTDEDNDDEDIGDNDNGQ